MIIFFKRFYLFILRDGKGGRKRGRDTLMCGCLSHTPYQGPGPQPRHVSWQRIKLVTQIGSQHSIHWATPARANWDSSKPMLPTVCPFIDIRPASQSEVSSSLLLLQPFLSFSGICSNKSFVHLILSWLLLLGRPEQTELMSTGAVREKKWLRWDLWARADGRWDSHEAGLVFRPKDKAMRVPYSSEAREPQLPWQPARLKEQSKERVNRPRLL